MKLNELIEKLNSLKEFLNDSELEVVVDTEAAEYTANLIDIRTIFSEENKVIISLEGKNRRPIDRRGKAW